MPSTKIEGLRVVARDLGLRIQETGARTFARSAGELNVARRARGQRP